MMLLPFALCLSLATQPPAAAAQVPEDATYYFLLGRYLEGGGKIDEAIAALKKAIALDPRSAEPRAELAGLYARQDKASEAVTAAEDALKVNPKNREANRILGSVLAALSEQHQPARPGDDVSAYPKRAIAALEIARGDGSGDLSIDLGLARLYLDADRPTDAIPLLRRIVLEQPQYAEGSVLLADAQEAAGAPDAAVETLTNLLDDQPQFSRGRVQLAQKRDLLHRVEQVVGERDHRPAALHLPGGPLHYTLRRSPRSRGSPNALLNMAATANGCMFRDGPPADT